MSAWLIAATGFIYLGVSLDQWLKDHWAMALVYFAYALANVGLWALAIKST